MLERVIDWSLAHRGQVLIGTALVLVAGVIALRNLNVDAFADTTPVQVQINTQATALVPEEVERQITFPVELALGGIPGLEEVRSISMYGLSQVVATFAEGTDVYFARQLVYQRLSSIELPPKIGPPELGPPSTGLGEVFHYLLVPRESARIPLVSRDGSESKPIAQPTHERQLTMLRATQDRKIKPVLRQVPNTAEVNSWGGFEKQYQVRLDPGKLRKFHLSFEQVVSAINANNMAVGGGNIEASGDMLLVHGRGRTVTLDQIADIVIVAEAGVPVYVKDVADVAIGHAVRAGAVTATVRDSHRPNRWLHDEAVLGLGFALMGHNSYAVTQDLYKAFTKLMPDVARELEAEGEPASSIEVVIAYDRTELVNRVIATVTSNLLEGACMVVLILFMFLGNLRRVDLRDRHSAVDVRRFLRHVVRGYRRVVVELRRDRLWPRG